MLDIFYKRRSTRKFLNQRIEAEKIKKLLTAAMLAPSSRGLRPWEFILVDDPTLLEKLAMSKPHGASLLRHAPLAIIIAGDKTRSDVWVEDCSIASLFIQLEAEVLGLGSCWVQINHRFYNDDITSNEYIHDQFKIPERLEVLSVIGIGYKAAERPPMSDLDISWDKVSLNKFGGVFDKQ
ncbi:MAG: nitroreductase family protein [Mariniphaga sp.]